MHHIKKLILLVLITGLYKTTYSQRSILDSLTQKLQKVKHDTARCVLLYKITEVVDINDLPLYNDQLRKIVETNLKTKSSSPPNFYLKYQSLVFSNDGFISNWTGDYTKALENFNKALKIQEEIDFNEATASSLINIGTIYQNQGDIPKTLQYFQRALKIQQEIDDERGKVFSLTNLGTVYEAQGDILKALEYYNNALKICEKINYKEGISSTLNNIGGIYKNQGNNVDALKFYNNALKILNEIKDEEGTAYVLDNIGSIYQTQHDLESAMDYNDRALKIRQKINDKAGIAMSLNNKGTFYLDQDKLTDALNYFMQSLTIEEELKDKKGISITSNKISQTYLKQEKLSDAIVYANRSLILAKELGYPVAIKNAAFTLKNIYQKQNKYPDALKMYELYIQMRDSINNENIHKSTIKKQFQVEYEKKALKDSTTNAIQRKVESLKNEQEIKQQQTYTYGGILGFLLMFIVAIISFKAFKNKEKANIIITEQKQIAEDQKHIIEEKQKEIFDSITYAKRLQDAILPNDKRIKQHLPNSFVLYKPKDIVAGDFYWMETKDSIIYFAAADCTGHGVPGAMVSIVCSTALNRALLEFNISDPGKILDKTRALVLETFAKSDIDIKDGMDISLCSIDLKNNRIYWSGANNPFWYTSKNELIEIKAHKQPIGFTDNPIPFPTHTITFSPGDTIYLITDGFADQFGGPKGKKFKYTALKELLLEIQYKPVDEQKAILDASFEKWKQNMEQVDDVTIVGIKL